MINKLLWTNSSPYSIEKFDESNYHSWSQIIESHLDDQDLWEIVKGEEEKPISPGDPSTPETVDTHQQHTITMTKYEMTMTTWTKKIKKIRKLIISTISLSIMIYIENTKDSMEMWEILEGRYKSKTWIILHQL